MSNPVLKRAKRAASNAMFGRSNSLSINTGTANSTLYAPSSPSSSFFPQKSPSVTGSAGPPRETPVTAFNINFPKSDIIKANATSSTGLAGPPRETPVTAFNINFPKPNATSSTGLAGPTREAPVTAFNINFPKSQTPKPDSTSSTGLAGPNRGTSDLPSSINLKKRETLKPDQSQWAEAPTTQSFPNHYDEREQRRRVGLTDESQARIASSGEAWLDKNWKPPSGPPIPPDFEKELVAKPRTLEDSWRPDLAGPGPRKMLTPRSGSQQQAGGSQPQQGGGIFGGAAAGTTQTSQAQGGNSLFGGSLFGNNQTQPQQSAQQAPTGGLFGNSNAQSQPQQEQKPASGGLFGGGQTTQAQQPAGGSLFGGGQTTQAQQPAGGSLFGGGQTNQTTQQTTQQPSGGSLFGGAQPANTNKPATTGGLFGGAAPTSGGLFGNSTAQQPATNSLFGGTNQSQSQQQQQQQQRPTQTSLLGASRYNQSQYQPFVTGRLTMGQGQGGAPQPTAIPATKLDWSNVRSTTRFNDLTDEAKRDIEQMDKLISQQEAFCKQIEAFLPNHQSSIVTLGPDVRIITEKLEEVDRSLAVDAQGVQQDKNITEKDEIDIDRCIRIIDNLRMPAQYIYHPAANSGRQPQPPAWDETYDVDLIGNYFQPLTQDMARLLATYSGNMAEIENHMGTIEHSAMAQAHQLSAQRSGMGGQRDVSGDSVRQLADTLRGFESSILSAAGRVGECREGVNELVLGKLGGSHAARRGW